MRTITNEVVERIAGEADVTTQTVTRYIARLPQKPRIRLRIERALRRLRWHDLLVPELAKTGTDD
jgi:predicted transcriptional regulator